jgi:hypothetical protein
MGGTHPCSTRRVKGRAPEIVENDGEKQEREQKKKQIPCGNDNPKKSTTKTTVKAASKADSLRK